jgi:ParB-like chromosome segregation protein Spo0J
MNPPQIVSQIEQLPIARLRAYRRNARKHSDAQIQQIAASIREFGFVNPILIGMDKTIIAGHARLRAAEKLGMTTVPVIVLSHLSEAQRRALVIADNQLALNAAWDEKLLRAELAALKEQEFAVDLTGFAEQELARLIAEQEKTDRLTDPDAMPAEPTPRVTRPEDQWLLGSHRLLCGDATNLEAIERVLHGDTVQLVFTDLPSSSAHGDGFDGFLRQVCNHLTAVCQGAIYVCTSPSDQHTLYRAFCEAGGQWSAFLIWAKPHLTSGGSEYQRQYVSILYGWPRSAKHHWCGDRNQSDLWSFLPPLTGQDHHTRIPVELVERAVDNSSRTGDTVFDPFAGSGTTLIACERRGRRARLIEIDPLHVDLICRRWEQYTGKAAALETDGRTFQQIAAERQTNRLPSRLEKFKCMTFPAGLKDSNPGR